ncbi:MAG: hypothetical protein AMXMBFR64_24400 [Myxococcales bacterium]
MKERALEVKVGALVIVCLALFVAFVFLLGDFTTKKGAVLFADFPNSVNLKAGAPVKISGVTVGKVEEVAFWGGREDPKLGRRVQVRVRLEIEADKVEAVHDDASAYITTLGVLGEKYVEIDPGSWERPSVEPGFVIVGMAPFQLEKIGQQVEATLTEVNLLLKDNRALVHELLQNVNTTVKDAGVLVTEARPKLLAFVDRLTATTDKVDQVLASVQAGLGDGSDVRATLQDVRATAENARKISVTVNSAIQPVVGKVQSTLDTFKDTAGTFKETASTFKSIGEEGKVRVLGTLDRVDGILSDAKDISAQLRDGRGTVGALMGDRELYDDVKEMVKDLKRHPWKFIWKE